MEQMREEGAKLLCSRLSGCSGFCHARRCTDAIEEYGEAMDAALSLMQPEIDRRLAEERAKLLERLWEPSEGMIGAGYGPIYDTSGDTRPEEVWSEMLAQFKREQSDAK